MRIFVTGATGYLGGAVAGTPIPMIEVAQLSSRAAGAGGEIRSVPIEALREELGPVADALVRDQVVAARRPEEALGWVPEQASYRDGVESAHREWKGAGA